LWVDKGVTGPASSKCPYRGAKANAEYQAISGCPVVPTENDGYEGDGTYCSHWDEQCLKTEVMTGSIGAGISPLSRITIATAEDLGYKVSYTPAESFTRNDLGPGCTCNRRSDTEIEKNSASPHPNVRQLGLRDPSTKRRKLSDEAYATAVTFGQGILAARKAKQPDAAVSGPVGSNDAVIYVGATAVVVYVEDNGSLFDVVVRAA
jgi:Leishmanolysin